MRQKTLSKGGILKVFLTGIGDKALRRFLWTALWISMSLNVIYFVETDIWVKKPTMALFALVQEMIERVIVS